MPHVVVGKTLIPMQKQPIRAQLVAMCLLMAASASALLGCGSSNGGAAAVRIQTPTPSAAAAPPTHTPGTALVWRWPEAEGAVSDRVQPAQSLEVEAPAAGTVAGWSVHVPSIGIDAVVATFGVSPAGVMEVPADASTVAWYDFTSLPGAPGNAVLAAHVDWAGKLGVFNRIDELKPGARITLVPPDGTPVSYEVRTVELVDPATADVAALIGTRSGDPTLTMITCGGEFNQTTRDYERRVIVRAVHVEAQDAARS